MRGSLGIGLIVGVALGMVAGATAMYLALRPPWGSAASSGLPPATTAPVPNDAGIAKAKPKRHRPHRGATAGERGWSQDDPEKEPPPQRLQLSVADRTMEWRGDDTSLPPQKIDMSNESAARSLSDHEIQSTIEAQSGPLRSCVAASATNTGLSGTMTVKLVVDGNGRVTKAKLSAFRYMFEQGLLSCVRRAVEPLRFPATGAPTLVTLPVEVH